MSDVRFDGRVVVISGAGRGMGRSHAIELARRGARVVVNDLGTSIAGEGSSVEPAHEVVAEITGSGGIAVANQDDVSTHEGAARIVATAVESFGRVDAIIHNASLASFIPFPEMTRSQFDTMLAVNAGGGFSLANSAWPHMVEAGYGRLLMILSATGLYGNHELAHYAAAKAALMGLTAFSLKRGLPTGYGRTLLLSEPRRG